MAKYQQAFSENLRAIRQAHGRSQQYIADVLGISRSAYTCYENGKSMPSLLVVCKLADIYGIEVEKLILPEDCDEAVIKRLRRAGWARSRRG